MPKMEIRKPNRRRLKPALRRRLTELERKLGVGGAAASLGLHPQTLANLAAGFAGNNSTVELVERRLAELGEPDHTTPNNEGKE